MRVTKPISLLLTDFLKVSLDNYLVEHPPTFKYDKTYFYYILNHILAQQNRNKKRMKAQNNFNVHINIKKMQLKTTANISSYIKILKNGEFLKCDENYQIGKSPKSYTLNPRFLTGEIISIEIDSSHHLFNGTLKEVKKKRTHKNRLDPHLYLMYKKFMSLKYNEQGAKLWINSQSGVYKKLLYTSSVNNIIDKRFRYFERNKTNKRVDTNLTNSKSELRQFMIGDFVSIDLKNSQPFFLSILLTSKVNKSKYKEGTLCYLFNDKETSKTFGIKPFKEISKISQIEEESFLANLYSYYESVLTGNLYDDFVKSFGNGITREEVKEIMFQVMFSDNKHYQEKKEIFASVFPSINSCIEILKKDRHEFKKDTYKKLPIFLQKVESYIFIDCIAKELVNNGIVPFTIHDSIIVEREHSEKALMIMKKVFLDQFQVIPTFKVESLKPE